ncbi:thioredoxin domain-containing protein [Marinobacterium maritimum]|uniref:Thioredoxin domain-containing protein n=1 Tax=Marinobacterium maritimum TaxID=500162 RepID=A0ABN1I644_9GAMM
MLLGATWLVLMLMYSPLASAEPENESELQAVHAELKALREEQNAVREELVQLKKMLMELQKTDSSQAKSVTPPVTPSLPMEMMISGSPYLGSKDAPVVLIEFTDYQCPFCRRHFEQTHPRLITELVDTGKLRIVMKEFPIQKLHPLAPRVSMAAQCADEQQKYWPMHDLLFQNQTRVSMGDLKAFAASVGIDTARFVTCMEEGRAASRIRSDFDLGVSAGVRGTPFFFIGALDPANPGTVRVERYLYGAQPFDAFAREIQFFLNR